MKKAMVLALTFLFVIFIAQGQAPKTERMQSKAVKKTVTLKKLEGKEISSVAKANFKVDFGDIANVKWSRSAYFDEASFTKNGVQMIAYYDLPGKLVGTTSVKKFTDLPEGAQKKIQTEYKDYTVGTVLFFDDNEDNPTDMYLYGQQFDDSDNYFVELKKQGKTTILQVNPAGEIFLFTEL